MKHCISIQPKSSYARILSLVSAEDDSATAREFIRQRDEDGPYMLLTIVSRQSISGKTEQAVDSLANVLASTFNIDED